MDAEKDMRNNLYVKSVTVERSNRPIIRNLSLAATNGNLIHLKGANGTGKTTLLRTIAGLITPTKGEVLWNDSSINKCKKFRLMLNFVSQKSGLAEELTTYENLKFLASISEKNRKNTVERALQQMNLSQIGESATSVLSAGQKQRATLTQLLLFDCPLWLLDEPFNSLDSDSCKIVELLIDSHVDEGGIAIVASHQLFDSSATQKTVELS